MTVSNRPAPEVVTAADVERLVRFDGHGARVLNVYLPLAPGRHVNRAYRIVLEARAKAAGEPLEKQARLDLEAEVARVRDWLDEERPRARGLAVFSSSDSDLWA